LHKVGTVFIWLCFWAVSPSDSSHVSTNFTLLTGDKEKELGLPISPLCDRDTVKKADSQLGFLKFVVRPTYLLLGEILPKITEVVMPIIDEQICYWGQKKAKILLQDNLSNVKVMSGVVRRLSQRIDGSDLIALENQTIKREHLPTV
jgi:hypothetical protein